MPGAGRAHIHMRMAGEPNQRLPLLLRDHLRAHLASATPAEVTRQLAAYSADDADAYCPINGPVCSPILDTAESVGTFEIRTTTRSPPTDTMEPRVHFEDRMGLRQDPRAGATNA